MANTPDIDASFEKALRAFLRKHERAAEGCPDSAILSAYYEHALAEDEAQALDEHLAACVDCQAELALLARLDPDALPVPREEPPPAPAFELKAEQLEEPAAAEEKHIEETTDVEEDEPSSVAPREFIPAVPRSRWRWVAPTALAATAVIAVSVTYRFAVDEASRRGVELQSVAPRREPPAMPPLEPKVKAPPVEGDLRPRTDTLSGSGGELENKMEAEHEKAMSAVPPPPPASAPAIVPPPPPAPAAIAPQPRDAAKSALAKKEDGAANERRAFGDELARSEKPAMLQAPREKQQLADESAGAAGGRATAPPAVAHVAPRGAFVVASRTNDQLRWRFTGSTIELTEDGGRSWQTQSDRASTSILAASAPSGEVCWAIGQGGVVMRTIDGKSWQTVTSPTNSDLVHVNAWDGSTATVKSADGSRFSTNDGGMTWSKR